MDDPTRSLVQKLITLRRIMIAGISLHGRIPVMNGHFGQMSSIT